MIKINPIQKFVLDVKFVGINQSNNFLFDKLSNLSNSNLIPFLSKLFDDEFLNALHFEFGKIEIDLGVISYDKFENTFFELFKKAIKEQFKDIINTSVSNSNNTFNLKDNVSNNLELIKYYLLNGRLPWWVSKLPNKNIISTIEDFINSNPNVFKSLILELGQNENVRKRFVYSLPEYIIKKLIVILEPTDFDYIFSYHTSALSLNKTENIIKEPENSFSKALWFYILSYLIQNQSSQFQKKQFLKRNLESIATFYNTDYFNLLELLFLSSLEFHLTQTNAFYDFIKDIQFIFKEEIERGNNINKVKPLTSKKYIEHFQDKISFKNKKLLNLENDFDEDLFIITYYLKYGSLHEDYKFYTIDGLKNIFHKLYIKNPHLVKIVLLNISISYETSKRLFTILNKLNYLFAIDLIIKNNTGTTINVIHKSFIQLLISQAKSTAILLSDDFKFHLLQLVYHSKNPITFKDLLSFYIFKVAKTYNISISDTYSIYVNDLKVKVNLEILNKLGDLNELEITKSYTDSFKREFDSNSEFKDVSVFNLLQFIIEYNYIPWWGKDLYNSGIHQLIDELFNTNRESLFLLLKKESISSHTRFRLLKIIGIEKTEIILLSLLDNDAINIYQYFKEFNFNYLQINKINLFNTLWEILHINSYSKIDSNKFISEFILYFNSLSNESTSLIYNTILSNATINLPSTLSNKLYQYINKKVTYNYILFNKKILFNNLNNDLKLILINENFNYTILENFIILNFKPELELNIINIQKNAALLLSELLFKGVKPTTIANNTNFNINTLIFHLFDYLFTFNKSELYNILIDFNLFKNEYKFIVFDWVFHSEKDSLNNFIIETIYPLIEDIQFLLIKGNISTTSIIYNNETDIELISIKINSVLKIQKSFSLNDIYEQYQINLIKYLNNGFEDKSINNEDEVLMFLTISIYNKGQKYLLDIFNSSFPDISYKNKIVSLFSNANNIRDRQIYYLLLRSIDAYTINSTTNNSIFYLNSNNAISNEFTDIKEIKPLYEIFDIKITDVNNVTSNVVSIYSNTIQGYLIQLNRPTLFNSMTNDEWIHYLKLMIEELTNISPSSFKNIISNPNNDLQNLIFIFSLFNATGSNIYLIIRNIFIDFFNFYITKLFKDLEIDINLISKIQFKDWIFNSLLSNKKLEITILLNSKFYTHLDKIDTNLLFTESNKTDSVFNSTILKIFFNILNDSFVDLQEQKQFQIILNEYHLRNITDLSSESHILFYIDKLIIHIYNYNNTYTSNYLSIINQHIQSLSISQPIQLIKILDYFILKSDKYNSFNTSNIITNNSINELSSSINNDIDVIKKQYIKEQKKLQEKAFKENLIFSATSNSEEQLLNEPIYINNVGLVLFNLFIPTYFSRLNLLNIDGDFKDEASKYKAVHLLQILVSDAQYEEHDLVFNKVLCNLPIIEPIPMDIIISDQEKELSNELLAVFIQRWDKMKNSSVEHLRAAFFMRDGRLILKEDGWYLTVEKRGYDLILQTLPWSFGVTKFKWMSKTLNTEWI